MSIDFSGYAQAAASAFAARLNYKIAKENRQWQERMSNTAHRREVNDLRQAGLNPILSATGGSGSSTPSSPALPDLSGIENAVSSAFDVKKKKQEIKTEETVQDLNRQQANKAQYEADSAHSAAAYQNEQTRQLMEFGPQQAQANIELTKAQAQAARNSAVATKVDTDFSQQHPILYGLSRVGGPVAGLSAAGVGAYSAYQTHQINKAKLKSKK